MTGQDICLSSWSRAPTHGGTGHVLRGKERSANQPWGIGADLCFRSGIQKQDHAEKMSRVLGGLSEVAGRDSVGLGSGSFCLLLPRTSWAFLGCGPMWRRGWGLASGCRPPHPVSQLPVHGDCSQGRAVHEHPLPRLVTASSCLRRPRSWS